MTKKDSSNTWSAKFIEFSEERTNRLLTAVCLSLWASRMTWVRFPAACAAHSKTHRCWGKAVLTPTHLWSPVTTAPAKNRNPPASPKEWDHFSHLHALCSATSYNLAVEDLLSSRVSHTLDHILRVCVWLPAPRAARRFIRIVMPFLTKCHSTDRNHLLIHASLDGHFVVFAILNKAAMSLQGQVFVWISFHFFWVNTWEWNYWVIQQLSI